MNYGCLLPKKDIRDYQICSTNNPNVVYPKELTLPNLPKVKNQGNVNSCAAHATSSILEYHAKNEYNLSTNFIYGIQKQECGHMGQGMYLKDACKIAQKYGDFLERDCAGNNEIPVCYSIAENALRDDSAVENAYQFRIDNYFLCKTDNDIKYALMNYGPVLCGIMWHDGFNLDANNVIHFNTSTGGGGHSVACLGWSDSKKAWLIQNSWGENWGDKGRFWLPYEYGIFEARAIVDYINPLDITLKAPNKNTPRWMCKICNFVLNIFKKRVA